MNEAARSKDVRVNEGDWVDNRRRDCEDFTDRMGVAAEQWNAEVLFAQSGKRDGFIVTSWRFGEKRKKD